MYSEKSMLISEVCRLHSILSKDEAVEEELKEKKNC